MEITGKSEQSASGYLVARMLPFTLLFITAMVSYWFYGPHNPGFFNSDQAIHTLMANDFKWPEDGYYWGQNRLGSLLPWLAYLTGKIIPVHQMYLCGFINYLFLTGFCLLAFSYIKTLAGKMLVTLAVFLPHPTYIYLLLSGHPYAAQIFTAMLSIRFLTWYSNNLSLTENMVYKQTTILSLGLMFAIVSIWISELSLLLFIGAAIYILQQAVAKSPVWKQFLNRQNLIIFFLTGLIWIMAGAKWLYYLKKHATALNTEYSRIFISANQVGKQAGYLLQQLSDIILLRNHDHFIQCLFYYVLAAVALLLFSKRNKPDTLLLTLTTGSVILFFSFWNFRSNFDAKYFIPIYIGLIFWIACNKTLVETPVKKALYIALLVLLTGSNLVYMSRTRSNQTTKSISNAYSNIPEGVLYGNYWTVYRAAGYTNSRLTGVSMHGHDRRNMCKYDQWGKLPVWYLYPEVVRLSEIHNDTIHIAYTDWIVQKTGKTYYAGNDTLIECKNLIQ